MNKILNAPEDFVSETLEGILLASDQKLMSLDKENRVIVSNYSIASSISFSNSILSELSLQVGIKFAINFILASIVGILAWQCSEHMYSLYAIHFPALSRLKHITLSMTFVTFYIETLDCHSIIRIPFYFRLFFL